MHDENNKDTLYAPQETYGDAAHTVTKGLIGIIPYIGGPAAEAFGKIIVAPIENRRNEWCQLVTDIINEWQMKGLTEDNVFKNERFTSAVIKIYQVFMSTHESEKRECLKNALFNSAFSENLDDSLVSMFLNFINEFTTWHVKILDLFDNSQVWFKQHNKEFPTFGFSSSLHKVVEAAFPELKERRDFYDLIWSDLYRKKLVNTESLHGMMTASGVEGSRTTDTGKSFLSFLTRKI